MYISSGMNQADLQQLLNAGQQFYSPQQRGVNQDPLAAGLVGPPSRAVQAAQGQPPPSFASPAAAVEAGATLAQNPLQATGAPAPAAAGGGQIPLPQVVSGGVPATGFATRTPGQGTVPLATSNGEQYFVQREAPQQTAFNTPLGPGAPSLNQLATVFQSPLEQMQRSNPFTGERFVSPESQRQALSAWLQSQNNEANRQAEFARTNLRFSQPGTYTPAGLPAAGGQQAQTPLQAAAGPAPSQAQNPLQAGGAPPQVGNAATGAAAGAIGSALGGPAAMAAGAAAGAAGGAGSNPMAPPLSGAQSAQTPVANMPGTPAGLMSAIATLPPYLQEIALQHGMTGQTQRDITQMTHGPNMQEQNAFNDFIRSRVASGLDLAGGIREWNEMRGQMPFNRPAPGQTGAATGAGGTGGGSQSPQQPLYHAIEQQLNQAAGVRPGEHVSMTGVNATDLVTRLAATNGGQWVEQNWPAIESYINARVQGGVSQLAAIRNRYTGLGGAVNNLLDRRLISNHTPNENAEAVMRRLMGAVEPQHVDEALSRIRPFGG
jgi:hypothetical protein